MARRTTVGFVYLVHDPATGLHKIGLSANPKKRSQSLGKVSLLHTIRTNDARRLEAEFHATYAEVRQHGEWFALSDEMVEQVRSVTERMYETGRPICAVTPVRNVSMPAPWAAVIKRIANARRTPPVWAVIALLQEEAARQGLTNLPAAPWDEDELTV